MYRYILMTLIGLVGLTAAAMAQEVTATGNYKGQDFALSRRVEILRAALDATVQQVQKITICNAKGMVYVSSTAAGTTVDADGCAAPRGAASCIRVYRPLGPFGVMLKPYARGEYTEAPDYKGGDDAYLWCMGFATKYSHIPSCISQLHSLGMYHRSEVPDTMKYMGIWKNHAYIQMTGSTDDRSWVEMGYVEDLYCDVNIVKSPTAP